MAGDDAEAERKARAVKRAKVRRTSVINQIKTVHNFALRLEAEPALGPTVISLAGDLDALWIQLRAEDDAVLDGLCDLDKLSEYDDGLLAEVRTCVSYCKVAAEKLAPKGADIIDLSYLKDKLGPTGQSAQNRRHGYLRFRSRSSTGISDYGQRFAIDLRNRLIRKCKSRPNCKECSRKHHTLLHLSPEEMQGGEEPPLVESAVCASVVNPPSQYSTLPTAFSSVFGWILIGPVPDRANCYYQSLPVSMTASIEGIMERFWHVEEPEDAPVTFTEEGCCEQIFRDEATRLTSGLFAVPLPFRAPAETFVGSREAIAATDCDGLDSVRNALEYQTYVDDICDGADTISDVLKLQSDLVSVLSKSGLELKKWASNTPAVLQAVPAANRTCAPMPFGDDDGYSTKVLGLAWHPDQDYFCCAVNLAPSPVFTKRGVLSLVARIFDPLGLFGPVVFLAKSIMQRTWRHGVAWDDPLPDDIHADWTAFVSELPSLLNVRVPRHINGRQGAPCYLLGFCDASQVGYAAVVYVRMINVGGDKSVFLIGTKTKLAPTKTLTVPRLVLNAAVLLAQWLGRIQKILSPQLDVVGLRAWSDSTIVLSWLTSPHESFKVYVSNRVHQIRSLLPDCHWQHIVSAENPADCASRGVMPAALAQLDLYWRGPQIAYGEPSEWDDSRPSLPLCELPELRVVSHAARVDDEDIEWFVRFSSFDRMLRIVAYMRRFVRACRRHVTLRRSAGPGSVVTPGSDVRVPAFLRKDELDSAARVLAAESQRVHFAMLWQELSAGSRISSKPLSRLAPFIDTAGVVRVGGRLRHSLLNYDCKHPVLLAKRSHFAMLLCRRWHLLSGHAGPRVLTALIARQYWVISLRSVLHNVLINCTVCVRLDAKPSYLFMADLPGPRVKPRRPFEQVGVDYAGPLQLKELRLHKSRVFKVYIAVFVCFTTKAVHLEVVTELSTDAFLAAFDRFVARRGLPADVYSDCGTNFVGADKQLRALIQSPDSQSPPLLWRLGRVTELLPGSDGHVRVARVLTRAGVMTRPVVKSVKLPTNVLS
ncbi:hypothetical protein QTP88_007625 [Uroleucon formosanum]